MERKVLPERPFEARGRGVHPPVFVSRGNKGLTGEIVVSALIYLANQVESDRLWPSDARLISCRSHDMRAEP